MSSNGLARRVRLGVAALSALAVGVAFAPGAAPASTLPAVCENDLAAGEGCSVLQPAGGDTFVFTVAVPAKDASAGDVPSRATSFELFTGAPATNLRPSNVCHPDGTGRGVSEEAPDGYSTTTGKYFITRCDESVAAGGFTQVCYDGGGDIPGTYDSSGAPFEDAPYAEVNYSDGGGQLGGVGELPAVSGCPVSAGSPTGHGLACVVPNVKSKALAAAERAIVRAHCAVGTVKRVKSQHVKKGIVISQKPRAGSKGPKVSLDVSKGR